MCGVGDQDLGGRVCLASLQLLSKEPPALLEARPGPSFHSAPVARRWREGAAHARLCRAM